jgi:DNA-binding NarL/FixJ family response regulator
MLYKIAVIEDDPGILASLERIIRSYTDLICIVSADSMESFWEKLPARASLDMLVLDLGLPGQSGLEGLPILRKRFPEAEIIIFSGSEDTDLLLRCLTLGANGFVVKGFPIMQFRKYIDTVLQGGAAISPKMARKMIEYMNPPKRDPGSLSESCLSSKEEQVLRLLSEGNNYEQVALLMDISVNGVKYHVKNIYKKTNVNNKLEAIRLYKDGFV